MDIFHCQKHNNDQITYQGCIYILPEGQALLCPWCEEEDTPKSTSHWLRSLEHETHERCPECFSMMMQPISFKSASKVVADTPTEH